jgi:amino acid transporter
MAVSRSVFAWSFDRVIPSKFAEIHERLRVPVFTIVTMSIVWAASLIAYTYGPPSFLSLASGAAVGENTSVMIVCLAAIIFPFRRKSLFEPSPANMKIGPVPLLSLTGIISFVFIGLIQYFLLSNPLYGANTPPVLMTIVIIFVIGGIIYAVSYFYNKKQGLDISMIFRDIPPE